MTRTVHVSLSIRGVLANWGNRDLVNLLKDASTGRYLTAPEAKAALLDELANGREMLPMGEPCEGFDYKSGCPGHPVEANQP